MSLRVAVVKQLPHFHLDVDLAFPAGELTAIVGPSGAGKTTLMRLVAGLERPDHGLIALGAETWVDVSRGLFEPPQRRGVGLVFQDYVLFPHMTVERNVAFAARSGDRVPELLDLFGIGHLASARPDGISGGERQRVAFCQALAREPRLLLLDEPFSALDVATRHTLRGELKALCRSLDIPVLHVTHDLDEAHFLGDSVVSLVRGHVEPDWTRTQYRLLAAMTRDPLPKGFPSPESGTPTMLRNAT